MGICSGFAILSEDKNELTDKLVSFLKSRKKDVYITKKEGVYPNEWFVKNSHFNRKGKGKGKLKLFIEVSFRGRIFRYQDKYSPYDFETFDELNKIINENGDNKLYLFPFEVNSGIQKRKPGRMIKTWKGKLI